MLLKHEAKSAKSRLVVLPAVRTALKNALSRDRHTSCKDGGRQCMCAESKRHERWHHTLPRRIPGRIEPCSLRETLPAPQATCVIRGEFAPAVQKDSQSWHSAAGTLIDPSRPSRGGQSYRGCRFQGGRAISNGSERCREHCADGAPVPANRAIKQGCPGGVSGVDVCAAGAHVCMVEVASMRVHALRGCYHMVQDAVCVQVRV
jgi:hypothetical protein